MTRILGQAEEWFEKHVELLVKCGIEKKENPEGAPVVEPVKIEDMEEAVTAANNSVTVTLDEVQELEALLSSTAHWYDETSAIVPKRSKRMSKATMSKFRIEDLERLIKDASTIPIDTGEDVKRLQEQLVKVESWRADARNRLEVISVGFSHLRGKVNVAFDLPHTFETRQKNFEDDGNDSAEEEKKSEPQSETSKEVDNGGLAQMEVDEPSDKKEVSDCDASDPDVPDSDGPKGDDDLKRLLRELQEGAMDNGVLTPEAEAADVLDTALRWCVRSIKYIGDPKDVFDKRFYGAFDRFIKEGTELAEKSKAFSDTMGQNGWTLLVSDQLQRLEVLRKEREEFFEWCKTASQALADVKKLTMTKLRNLEAESRSFPAGKYYSVWSM